MTSYFPVTIYYPDNERYKHGYFDDHEMIIGFKWMSDIKERRVQIAEISEDRTKIWVEYCD